MRLALARGIFEIGKEVHSSLLHFPYSIEWKANVPHLLSKPIENSQQSRWRKCPPLPSPPPGTAALRILEWSCPLGACTFNVHDTKGGHFLLCFQSNPHLIEELVAPLGVLRQLCRCESAEQALRTEDKNILCFQCAACDVHECRSGFAAGVLRNLTRCSCTNNICFCTPRMGNMEHLRGINNGNDGMNIFNLLCEKQPLEKAIEFLQRPIQPGGSFPLRFQQSMFYDGHGFFLKSLRLLNRRMNLQENTHLFTQCRVHRIGHKLYSSYRLSLPGLNTDAHQL